MNAELQDIGGRLILKGDVQGGIMVKALGSALREAGLIGDNLDSADGVPLARGRKFGPATFDVDPEKVRQIRLERDLSQRSLANQSVLSTSLVSGVERGKYSTISGESARRLATGLGVDLQTLRRVEPTSG